MKRTSQLYAVSKDYEALYELRQKGFEIVCIVDYSFRGDDRKKNPPSRDIAHINMFSGEIGVRGMCYGGTTFKSDSKEKQKADFISDCESLNLEYIIPNI